MTSQKRFIFEVEAAKEATDGKPSVGPVYRSSFANDGFPNPIDGINSCWDIFRLDSVFIDNIVVNCLSCGYVVATKKISLS